ncbi:cyclin-A3-4-like isoform X1 [Impatiens glandulifera]|uniref:cyclin-A3-4-like isoform X1 n=1 Tax=Impatiens glandulifera TaxID=253017 RepID=UPI001FB19EA6|nr:cyclin-A3-4-like isoform X1 [Impatiens glandulifera]
MTDNENSVRVTRLTRKRAAEAMSVKDDSQPAMKKRVPLTEISNLSSIPSTKDLDSEPPKKKCRTRRTVKRSVVSEEKSEQTIEDPQLCEAYATDIYDYLHRMEVETKRRPLPDYIDKIQKNVTATMRSILVDWLVEVAEEYKLQSDTLYLSVNYIDKYLSINSIHRQRLQLLGVSAMLIASRKFEEINPPKVDDFCYITDNTYKKEDVVDMEADILKSLNFEISSPTIKTFLRRYTRMAEDDQTIQNLQCEFLGCYLAELSLVDYDCVKFLPSMIAASVIFLSKFTLSPNKHPWTVSLQKCSRYKPADLKECVLIIQELQLSKRGATLVAIREKYNQHKVKLLTFNSL